MGLRDDLDRFKTVGEDKRQDLSQFIQHGSLGGSTQDQVKIPIKVIDLPEFVYDQRDQGGVGQAGGDGQPEPGEPVDVDEDGDGDDGDGDDAGEDEGEHGYYEMDPEEFAEELDDELDLDLDPKGKKVIEEVEGDLTDEARQGPSSMLDVDQLFKRGLKRKLSVDFDEDFVREACRVEGADSRSVYEYARDLNIPVSYNWIERTVAAEDNEWASFDEMEAHVDRDDLSTRIRRDGLDEVPFRPEDERYRYPEIEKERQKNVVVINIRDVSGSMREDKRELVERVFTPLDWYLQGKYDHAEFHYLAHDVQAWEVERDDFFGIKSGGGTRISSAYELAKERLDEQYPWQEWNRYVFAAGDSENQGRDTSQNVIPLMEDIDANLHAYVETQPSGSGALNAKHAETVDDHFGEDDNVAVTSVTGPDDITDAIYDILSTEQE